MKCKNCGATLDQGALFCRKCGTAAPKAPEPKKNMLSGLRQRLSAAWAWCADRVSMIRNAKIWKNRRLLLAGGAALALLVLLIVIIASAASCGAKKTGFKTSDQLIEVAVDALERGDGERLYEMTKLSESLLGAHREVFGEGDTPEAVMRGYYTRLADGFRSKMTERYGKRFELEPQLSISTQTGSEIFETNRALGMEAEEFVTAKGFFSVDGEVVADTELYLVAAKLDGEWKLLVLYLY